MRSVAAICACAGADVEQPTCVVAGANSATDKMVTTISRMDAIVGRTFQNANQVMVLGRQVSTVLIAER